MPDEFPYNVFLSHNHADKPRVRRLAERLKAAGVPMEAGLRLWLDEWVIRAGEPGYAVGHWHCHEAIWRLNPAISEDARATDKESLSVPESGERRLKT